MKIIEINTRGKTNHRGELRKIVGYGLPKIRRILK